MLNAITTLLYCFVTMENTQSYFKSKFCCVWGSFLGCLFWSKTLFFTTSFFLAPPGDLRKGGPPPGGLRLVHVYRCSFAKRAQTVFWGAPVASGFFTISRKSIFCDMSKFVRAPGTLLEVASGCPETQLLCPETLRVLILLLGGYTRLDYYTTLYSTILYCTKLKAEGRDWPCYAMLC